jgi:hypothetical protein
VFQEFIETVYDKPYLLVITILYLLNELHHLRTLKLCLQAYYDHIEYEVLINHVIITQVFPECVNKPLLQGLPTPALLQQPDTHQEHYQLLPRQPGVIREVALP